MPGDVLFLVGIIPLLIAALRGVLYNKHIPTVDEHPADPLFSIVTAEEEEYDASHATGASSSVGLVSGGKARVDSRRAGYDGGRVAGRRYGYIDERGAFVEQESPNSGRGDSAPTGPWSPGFESETNWGGKYNSKWGGTYRSDSGHDSDPADGEKN